MGTPASVCETKADEMQVKKATTKVSEGYLPEDKAQDSVSIEEEQFNEETPPVYLLRSSYCAQCSTFRYHALAVIVCTVWLFNIFFVVWISLFRDNQKTMRISKGLVRKSSHDSARHKSVPDLLECSQVKPPKDTYGKDSLKLSQGSPENITSELSKNEESSTYQHYGNSGSLNDFKNRWTHPNSSTSPVNLRSNISSIAEFSGEGTRSPLGVKKGHILSKNGRNKFRQILNENWETSRNKNPTSANKNDYSLNMKKKTTRVIKNLRTSSKGKRIRYKSQSSPDYNTERLGKNYEDRGGSCKEVQREQLSMLQHNKRITEGNNHWQDSTGAEKNCGYAQPSQRHDVASEYLSRSNLLSPRTINPLAKAVNMAGKFVSDSIGEKQEKIDVADKQIAPLPSAPPQTMPFPVAPSQATPSLSIPSQPITSQTIPTESVQCQEIQPQLMQIQQMPYQSKQHQQMANKSMQSQKMSYQPTQLQQMPYQPTQSQQTTQQPMHSQQLPNQPMQLQQIPYEQVQSQLILQNPMQSQQVPHQQMQLQQMQLQQMPQQPMPFQQVVQFHSKHFLRIPSKFFAKSSQLSVPGQIPQQQPSQPQMLSHNITSTAYGSCKPWITNPQSWTNEVTNIALGDNCAPKERYPDKFTTLVPAMGNNCAYKERYHEKFTTEPCYSQKQYAGNHSMRPIGVKSKMSFLITWRHAKTKKTCEKPFETRLRVQCMPPRKIEVSSRIPGKEAMMTPPPIGYYVRKDFSNPNSSPELAKIPNFSSAGDMNPVTLVKANDPYYYGKPERNGNKYMFKSELGKQKALGKGDYQLHGTNATLGRSRGKHPKRLVIVGKIKGSSAGHKKIGKLESSHEFALAHDSKKRQFHRDCKCDDKAKVATKYQNIVKNTNTEPLGASDDSATCSFSGNLGPNEFEKKNSLHKPSSKIQNLKYFTRKPGSSHEDIEESTENQSCMNFDSETKPYPRRLHMYDAHHHRIGLLTSYYMNVNSNAGISDNYMEEFVGEKSEIKQTSGSSAQSSDQYYSTHTDTEHSAATFSEIEETSPTASITQEGDDVTIITQRQSEPSLHISRSSDKITQAEGEAGQAINDSELEKLQKYLADAAAKKAVTLGDPNHVSRSQGALATAPKESASVVIDKHRKKTKTTHAEVIKLESDASKKVASANGTKDAKRSSLYKPKQERQRHVPPLGDVQKTVASASDKSIKSTPESNRSVKVAKFSEGHNESLDTKLKPKPAYETYLDYGHMKEPNRQSRVPHNAQSQGVRSAESDHHYNPLKNHMIVSGKNGDISYIKRLVSLPKTMPSQDPTYKNYHSLTQMEPHSGIQDDISVFESKSPTISKVGTSSTSPLSQKHKEPLSSSVNKELANKIDAKKTYESPKREQSSSSKPCSPKRELSNLQKSYEENDFALLLQKKLDDTEYKETKESDSNLSEVTIMRHASATRAKMVAPNNTYRKTVYTSNRGESPQNKSQEFKHKLVVVKKSNGKENCQVNEVMHRNDQSYSVNSKGHQGASTSKKKGMTGYKVQSKSPEGKRRRTRTLRRNSDETDQSKPEKLKKPRSWDKAAEKKKRKKKQKQKLSALEDDDSQNTLQSTLAVKLSRSRSTESNKTTQTVLSSVVTPKYLVPASSEPALSPSSKYLSGDNENKLSTSKGSHTLSDYTEPNVEKENGWTSEETKKISSAETVSIPSASDKMTNPDDVLRIADPGKSLAKFIPLTSAGKVKKNEKDLQEAELGWNSSTFSVEEKVPAEKAKQNQKRAMVRYYIIKPKPKNPDKEVVASKLKRPIPRLNLTNGDLVGSSYENDANGDLVPLERPKPGQGKSVQFSDNIEDLEASKEENASERLHYRPDSDVSSSSAINKTNVDIGKTLCKATDVDTSGLAKAIVHKKDELQVTPPRKKRPVWLKKSSKDKSATNVKDSILLKPGESVKKGHSSDNLVKPSSRFNIRAFYPVKPMTGSPKFSNISLDKRNVAYNTWLSSVFLAAPMSKATKKIVAKLGSPVDIKEIIEGSSVDAADHFRAMKAAQEGSLRAARSVPGVGLHRVSGIDGVGGKKVKSSEETRLTSRSGKDLKLGHSESLQSHASNESRGDHADAVKKGSMGVDGQISPKFSTQVDSVLGSKKKGLLKFQAENCKHNTKQKRNAKMMSLENMPKWQVLAPEDARRVTNVNKDRDCNDVELNVLNMGIAWVVQSVVNKFPFLATRRTQLGSNTAMDVSSNHQLAELDNHARNRMSEC